MLDGQRFRLNLRIELRVYGLEHDGFDAGGARREAVAPHQRDGVIGQTRRLAALGLELGRESCA